MESKSPSSVELFSGGGGLALGIHTAGFEHRLLVDNDRRACETLTENARRGSIKGPWPVAWASTTEINFRSYAGVELVAGGPPCQPFSLGGQHRGQQDNRNLFPEAIRAVREIEPKAFLFENVKGLVRPSFFSYFEY